MVSTDSAEIEAVAVQYGADVPFRRTQKSSDDLQQRQKYYLRFLPITEKRENGLNMFVVYILLLRL